MINTNLPIYEIYIDLEDSKTGVEFNSLVHDPAHEISFQTFSKVKRYEFNDEKMIVSGIAISADTPIYRNEGNGSEYYVVFKKDAISDIVHDYARNGRFNNVNIEHNSKEQADGVYMIGSYQIDNDKGFTAPERFKDASDGSWITSYKFENVDLYNKVKAGEMTGFSIEGNFVLDEFEFSSEQTILNQLDEIISELKK
jgi:hypothetical protein